MAKKSSDYWKKRFEEQEKNQYNDAKEFHQTVDKNFRVAKNNVTLELNAWLQRIADNEGVSLARARQMLENDELKEFHWTVEEYIEKGEQNAVSGEWMQELENASAKAHISKLEAIQCQIGQEVELLYTKYEKGITDYLNKTFESAYYNTAYEIAKGTNIGTNLASLNSTKINNVLSKPWASDDMKFSDRIWKDKKKLANELNKELTQSIIRGDDVDKAITNISKKFDTSRVNAGRLIMTESAAVSSKAQEECFNDLDVEQFEFVATLDESTSEICQSMDGKVFKMPDYQVGVNAPPLHPFCRSCTVPYFDDFDDGKRAYRTSDGKTDYVSSDMKYDEWKEKYVNGDTDESIELDKASNEKNTTYKNATTKIANSGKSDIISESHKLSERKMANGQRISPLHVLSDEEIKGIKKDAKDLLIPEGILKYNIGNQTGYSDLMDEIHIRGDILPDINSNNNRDLMSQRAVLAHEYYGHYLSNPSKFRVGDWRDEFQASYKAAINTPNLSDNERRMLMLDAYDRAREAGVSVNYNKKARMIIYGYE